MKKIFLVVLSFFFCTIVFAQSETMITDVMSSQWLTVSNVTDLRVTTKPAVSKKVSVRKSKVTTTPKSSPSPKPPDAFNKTNTQVKRFKKSSG